jgi:hypothetical protein
MKKVFITVVLVLLSFTFAYAQDRCYSSGLKTADETITTETVCLCGVELIPAAADSTLVIYQGIDNSGTVLFKVTALASTVPSGFMPAVCINAKSGIYADVTGAAAAYIIWYR